MTVNTDGRYNNRLFLPFRRAYGWLPQGLPVAMLERQQMAFGFFSLLTKLSRMKRMEEKTAIQRHRSG